ncbi:MAG: restriction endonuclease subunit S [Christensenellales bacterium]
MTPQELKTSIIHLAMQGKLVEQITNDGTCNELIDAIAKEKKRLNIKKDKKIKKITQDDIPFDIPDSWCWVRFGDVVSYNMGKTPPRAESQWWNDEIPWVSIADMPENGHITTTKEGISQIALESKFGNTISKAGTMLMSFKLTIGRVSILDIDAVHNEAIISIYPYCDVNNTFQSYLFYLLPIITQYGNSKTAIKGKTLNSTSISNLLIPLPPLAEQKRIVEKIEEILPYIDAYAEAWSKLEKINNSFPEDIQKSLIQYAIEGKLVEQREEEGTAEELFKQIQLERKELIKQGKIKKEKPLPKITQDDIPFDIPDSWCWVRFGDVVSYNMGKTPPRAESQWWNDEIPWVSIADMPENGHITTTKEGISQIALESKFGNTISKAGTMLMSFKLTIGRVSILDIDAVHNEAIISIYPYCDVNNTFQSYLFYLLPIITQYGNSKTAIKGKTLNSTSISNLLIPLPPLAEQKRIVEKIEEILPYIDAYAEAWSKLEKINNSFPEDIQKSLIQYAIEGKLVEQREEEGTAEELFKQI